jgi:hypothetical protein
MRALYLPLLIVSTCASLHTAAQQDSTLDIGYLKLNRTFTQTVAISGADLERMPFTNLSDALSAYLFGAFTRPAALQYIVDGNPVTDVNEYSIHDIEEVIWVANAAALGATAGTQQQLIVIKTRRPKKPAGITATAQTGIVNTAGVSKDNRAYHDYYATAWRNWKNFGAGISANWNRDVSPQQIPNYTETTPFNTQRWRLNGHLNWQTDANNNIDAHLQFTSNELDYQYDSTGKIGGIPIIYSGASKQQLITMGLRWQGNWLPHLHNDLMTTYLLLRFTGMDDKNGVTQFTPTSEAQYQASDQSTRTSHHLWIRDRLSYDIGAGNWCFTPALNASYEHIDMLSGNLEDLVGAFPVSGVPGLTAIGISGSGQWQDSDPSDIFFLTPSADLTYKEWFNLKAGTQWSYSNWEYATKDHYFPFASLSLDLLRMIKPVSNNRLQLFASYARRTVQSINNYSLLDVSNAVIVEQPFPYYYGAIYEGKPVNYRPMIDSTFTYPNSNGPGIVPYTYPSPRFWVWSAGLSYTAWQGRIQAQYYVEKRNFTTSDIINTSSTDSSVTLTEWRSTFHHADIRATPIETPAVRWTTDLNLTILRSHHLLPANFEKITIVIPVVGDPSSFKSWTGGWTNRVQITNFTAGLDLLFHFNGQPAPSTQSYILAAQPPINPNGIPTATERVNSIVIPNIFAGYRFPLHHNESLEFFLESRGLLRTTPSDLLDQRRYYTIGGKFSL